MTVEQRIWLLERQHRRLRLAFILVVAFGAVGLGGLVADTYSPPILPLWIEARRFLLVDAEGTRRAELWPGGFAFWDDNDNLRAILSVSPDGTAFYLNDENGKKRLVLGAGQRRRADGTVTTYPESSIHLYDADGKRTWQAP